MKSEKLIEDSLVEWLELGDGIRRKVMAQNESMMIAKAGFDQHAIETLHHHPHTQASYVSKGKFEILGTKYNLEKKKKNFNIYRHY